MLTIVPRDVGRYCWGQGRLRWSYYSIYSRVGLVQPKDVSAIRLATRLLLAPPGDAGAIPGHAHTALALLELTCTHTHSMQQASFHMSTRAVPKLLHTVLGPGAIIPVLSS